MAEIIVLYIFLDFKFFIHLSNKNLKQEFPHLHKSYFVL